MPNCDFNKVAMRTWLSYFSLYLPFDFGKYFLLMHYFLASVRDVVLNTVKTEKFKDSVNKGNAFRAFLGDLSKAFDWIDHMFLIAKLVAFGFPLLSLKLIYFCSSNQKTQSIKTKQNFSDRTDIESAVPQGSVLEPLLIYIWL